MMDGNTFSWIVIAVLVGNALWYGIETAAAGLLAWWERANRKADRLIDPWDPDGDISGIEALRPQPGEKKGMPGPREGGLFSEGSSVSSIPPNPLDPSVTPLPPYGSQESGQR